jgi:formylglycine-generating enzyme required for sulfatase activity
MRAARGAVSIVVLAVVATVACNATRSPRASRASTCPPDYRGIPAGTFWMGAADGEGSDDERPIHLVAVAAFCMQTTEVTVAAYAACVSAGGCTAAVENEDSRLGLLEDDGCNAGKAEHTNHPVNCVDWEQSVAYCRWLGGRLPTEEEWEYGARGTDGRTYPWGNDAPSSQLCWRRAEGELSKWLGTCAVGSFSSGDSPFGLHDMAGNVWEWTSSRYCPYGNPSCADPYRVIRGGDWIRHAPSYYRATTRGWASDSGGSFGVGIRCAR